MILEDKLFLLRTKQLPLQGFTEGKRRRECEKADLVFEERTVRSSIRIVVKKITNPLFLKLLS